MKKTKISNSPITGFILSIITNVLFFFVLLNIGDYVSVSKDAFIIVVSAITALALLVNGLFVWGFAYKKGLVRKIFIVVSTCIILVFGVSVYYTSRLNKSIDKLIEKDAEEFIGYHYVTIEEGRSKDTLTEDNTIGYVAGDDAFNEAVLNEISSTSSAVEIVTFDRYEDMIHSMADAEELDVAILPKKYESYLEGLGEKVNQSMKQAKVIHEFEISVSRDTEKTTKVLEEPFTILMMGINENLADSIILATVNPLTLNVTMTSVGRDLYVPIACYNNQSFDKLNHARGRSRQCMIDTLEGLFDIDIDFFFETDFYALVKIVDVLGGLEIESPITFAGSLPLEDDPTRTEDIKIKEGKHLMNGKQVITFARERKHFADGDFQRQRNQQYVIREVADKIFEQSRRNIDTPIKVLEAAENNIVMNLSVNRDISPLLGLILNNISASPVDAMSTFNIESTQIQADVGVVGSYQMSVLFPYEDSIEDVKQIMKDNLSTEVKDPQKEAFSFSMNHTFYNTIPTDLYQYMGGPTIGSDYRYEKAPEPVTPEPEETPQNDISDEIEPVTYTVPTFNSLVEAQTWAANNGVTLDVTYVDDKHPAYAEHYVDGQIIYQSHEGSVNELPPYLDISIVDMPIISTPDSEGSDPEVTE